MTPAWPLRAFLPSGRSDWPRDGHVTHAGPMGVSHRILALTLGKEVLLPLGVAAELGE